MLRGISHTQNDKYYMISLIGDTYRVVKLIETETEWWLSGAGEWGKWGEVGQRAQTFRYKMMKL